ncbi:MAG: penicillin-binding protein 2, partial [Pseudomonadota bacterium]
MANIVPQEGSTGTRNRMRFISLCFILIFALIIWRVGDLAINPTPSPKLVTQNTVEPHERKRGKIVDRNGELLAISVRNAGLAADTKQIHDAEYLAARLGGILPQVPYERLLAKLSSGRRFAWLARDISPARQQEILELGEPGLQLIKGYKRLYPLGLLNAHVIGFVSDDNEGLGGLERQYNEELLDENIILELTLDARIQHALRNELQIAMENTGAIGAVGIVSRVETGEIFGMISLPDFDPNNQSYTNQSAKFNRATLGIYELGSTFKIFNTAMALEHGEIDMGTIFDATKPLHIGGHAIRDYRGKNRWLDVAEAFIYSSNISHARMADQVGGEHQKEFLQSLGMLKKVGIDYPEKAKPLWPSVWRRVNTMTIAYGHGLSVTPLHLVAGVSAIVNDGKLPTPHLLRARHVDGVREALTHDVHDGVISSQTSEKIRKLLRLNAIKGSGKRANISGYLVGGKTGTSEKLIDGKYDEDRLLSSFVAAFPINAPQYVVYVMLDEPKEAPGEDIRPTGGAVAAPVAGRIIARLGPILQIAPLQGKLEAA